MDGGVSDVHGGTDLKQCVTEDFRLHRGLAFQQERDAVRSDLDTWSEVGRAAFGHHTAAIFLFFFVAVHVYSSFF